MTEQFRAIADKLEIGAYNSAYQLVSGFSGYQVNALIDYLVYDLKNTDLALSFIKAYIRRKIR